MLLSKSLKTHAGCTIKASFSPSCLHPAQSPLCLWVVLALLSSCVVSVHLSSNTCVSTDTGEAMYCQPDPFTDILLSPLVTISADSECGVGDPLPDESLAIGATGSTASVTCDVGFQLLARNVLTSNSRRWQSKTLSNVTTPVTLTLHFSRALYVTSLYIEFKFASPERMRVEVRSDTRGAMNTVAIGDRTCSSEDASCVSLASSDLEVTFPLADSCLLAESNHTSVREGIRDVFLTRQVDIVLEEVGFPASLNLSSPDDLTRWQYYSIQAMRLSAMCDCNGHAGSCSNQTAACECAHNTVNESCSQCLDGYSAVAWSEGMPDGTQACVDTDECASPPLPCDVNANCTNSYGGFACQCRAGFSGDGQSSCSDIDECVTIAAPRCHPNASCANSAGSFECSCLPGYFGDGRNCSDVDECQSPSLYQCQDNAVCGNTDGSYTCDCLSGYQGNGSFCQDEDECESVPSPCNSNRANCSNTAGSYVCACRSGFIGDGDVCHDVDECTGPQYPCHAAAICSNFMGGYVCQCRSGLNGNGSYCQDRDECATATSSSLCHANANCTNLHGGYECRCRTGYTGTGEECSDFDECQTVLNVCGGVPGSECQNTLGSYLCQVLPTATVATTAEVTTAVSTTAEGTATENSDSMAMSTTPTDTGTSTQSEQPSTNTTARSTTPTDAGTATQSGQNATNMGHQPAHIDNGAPNGLLLPGVIAGCLVLAILVVLVLVQLAGRRNTPTAYQNWFNTEMERANKRRLLATATQNNCQANSAGTQTTECGAATPPIPLVSNERHSGSGVTMVTGVPPSGIVPCNECPQGATSCSDSGGGGGLTPAGATTGPKAGDAEASSALNVNVLQPETDYYDDTVLGNEAGLQDTETDYYDNTVLENEAALHDIEKGDSSFVDNTVSPGMFADVKAIVI